MFNLESLQATGDLVQREVPWRSGACPPSPSNSGKLGPEAFKPALKSTSDLNGQCNNFMLLGYVPKLRISLQSPHTPSICIGLCPTNQLNYIQGHGKHIFSCLATNMFVDGAQVYTHSFFQESFSQTTATQIQRTWFDSWVRRLGSQSRESLPFKIT